MTSRNPSSVAHSKRGRPHLEFKSDRDRFAVALLAAQMGIKRDGKFPSMRFAAKFAALWRDGWEEEWSMTYQHPPTAQPAGATLRRSPTNPIFEEGYFEQIFRHPSKRVASDAALDAAVKQIERKYRRWTRNGDSYEAAWIEYMKIAWWAAIQPGLVRQRSSTDPRQVCLAAARRAGEEDFAIRVLVPEVQARGF
jgi:hypothetical protein